MKTAKYETYLDLGDIGDCVSATMTFSWYKTKRNAPDDYDELQILDVVAHIGKHSISVLELLSEKLKEDLVIQGWESLDD